MVEHILLMVECVFVLCTTFALVIKTNSIMKEIKIVEKGDMLLCWRPMLNFNQQ